MRECLLCKVLYLGIVWEKIFVVFIVRFLTFFFESVDFFFSFLKKIISEFIRYYLVVNIFINFIKIFKIWGFFRFF